LFPGKKAVWLPRGIIIPCIYLRDIYYLKIRRPDADIAQGGPKTPQVLGSSPAIFGRLYRHDVAYITEGEWDCMLLDQAAGDLVGVATVGAAGHLPHGIWLERLMPQKRLYVVGDNDLAGIRGAEKWQKISQRVETAKVPLGKDITDYWSAGGDLRAWVKFSLAKAETAPAHYKTILWPAGAAIATIGGAWRRLPDGSIEATYHTVDDLRLAIEITMMIRDPDAGAQPEQIKQAEMFQVQRHNYQE
jgi:hypothetical protein